MPGRAPGFPSSPGSSPGRHAQAATRFFVGDITDRPGFLAGQVAGACSVELLVDPLLLQYLSQLLVLRDGYDNRNDLAAMVDHVMAVTGGQLAHEGHGNDMVRQPGA